MAEETAGSDTYQNEHMGLIFQEGLSFSGFERDKVFINDGTGRFADVSNVSGADHVGDGRALVQADFDDDGDLDVFLHNIQRERHVLYRNDAVEPAGRFVKVRLRGSVGSRTAAGAVVRLARHDGTVTARVQALGSGFVSQSAAEHVFGVAGVAPDDEGSVGRLWVVWPGGAEESFGAVQPGQRVLLVQGRGEPVPLAPQTFAFAQPGAPGVDLRVGDALTSVAVVDDAGARSRLELTSDGETLLNLWATTCLGCIGEMPDLQAIHERTNVQVIGLSVDPPGARARAPKLLEKRGVHYPSWFVDETALPAWLDLGRLTLPTTLRLDARGNLLEIVRGPIQRDGS